MSTKRRTFEIDWNSIDRISRVIRQLKARKRELLKGTSVEDKITDGKRFQACLSIMNTDISNIYEDLELDQTHKYYTYAHLDSSNLVNVHKVLGAFAATLGINYVPFYIGKGFGERDSQIYRNETHRKVVQRLAAIGEVPKIIKIRKNLTESQALQLEAKLVDIFGLVPNGGLLTNLDEGHNKIARQLMYREHLLCIRPEVERERLKMELFPSAEVISRNGKHWIETNVPR